MLFVYALAQAAAAAAPEVVQAAPSQGVISYPAAFFAAQQPTNALDMLERVPGFSLDTGETVRGYEGAAGNVLIDGQRPSSKNDNLREILSRLPASQVERIEIIRGGAPGIDMQGKTVLANVIRTKGRSFRGLAAVADGHAFDGRDAGSLRIEGSGDLGGGRKFELSARGGKGYDDGLGPGAVTRIPPGGPTTRGFDDAEGDILQGIAAGVFETPLAGGQARINGRVVKDKYKSSEDITLFAPASGFESSADEIKSLSTEIGGRFTRKLGAKSSLEAVALRQDRDVDIVSLFTDGHEQDVFLLNRDGSETIGRAVLKHSRSPTLSFEAGGEVALNKLRTGTRFTVDGMPIPIPAANVRVEELRSEAFGKATWQPRPEWTVDGQLRYETSNIESSGDVDLEKTLHYLKPRLAVTWQPRKSTQVRLRAEREVGQLNFDDFVANSSFSNGAGVMTGNPDIVPEQAWVGEVALEQRFWTDGALVLTWRHFEIEDVIDRGPDPTGSFDSPANIGDGTKDEYAVELTVPLARFGLKGAQFKGDVTWRDSKVTDPTTGERREISNLHPIDWHVSYNHDLKDGRFSYGVEVDGGRRETAYRFDAVTNFKLKPTVEPYVEWRPTKDWTLRFEVQNATERGLRLTRYSYDPVRTVGAVPNVDDRDLQFGRIYYLRIQKTFGG